MAKAADVVAIEVSRLSTSGIHTKAESRFFSDSHLNSKICMIVSGR